MDAVELREQLPTRIELLWPSYVVIRDAGRPLRASEHDDLVAQHLDLDPVLLDVPASNPSEREFAVRLRTARHHLKRSGLIRSGGHGVWLLAEDYPQPPSTPEELTDLKRQADRRDRQAKAEEAAGSAEEPSEGQQIPAEEVLSVRRSSPPMDSVTALLQQQRQSIRERLTSLRRDRDGVVSRLQKIDAQIELLEDEYRERMEALRQHGIIVDSVDDWS